MKTTILFKTAFPILATLALVFSSCTSDASEETENQVTQTADGKTEQNQDGQKESGKQSSSSELNTHDAQIPSYTVQHLWQNINNDDYTLYESEELTGEIGAETEATAKSYEGFKTPTVTQTQITADGNTVIKIYYVRKTFTVTYENGGRYTSGQTSSSSSDSEITVTVTGIRGTVTGIPEPVTYRYGAKLVAPKTPPETSAAYDFIGWYTEDDKKNLIYCGEVAAETITSDITLKAAFGLLPTMMYDFSVYPQYSKDPLGFGLNDVNAGKELSFTIKGAQTGTEIEWVIKEKDGSEYQSLAEFNAAHASNLRSDGATFFFYTKTYGAKYNEGKCYTITAKGYEFSVWINVQTYAGTQL